MRQVAKNREESAALTAEVARLTKEVDRAKAAEKELTRRLEATSS
jgi:hypothetical protein